MTGPNGLGFDLGPWEVMLPFGSFLFRARHFQRGESLPDRYGEGPTAEAAMANATPTDF